MRQFVAICAFVGGLLIQFTFSLEKLDSPAGLAGKCQERGHVIAMTATSAMPLGVKQARTGQGKGKPRRSSSRQMQLPIAFQE